MIPQVPFEDFVTNPNGSQPIEEIKTRGCVVVKGVVPPETALRWKQAIVDFCLREPGVKGRSHLDAAEAMLTSRTGYPEDAPQVFELYWTLAQLEARGHPSVARLSAATSRRLTALARTATFSPPRGASISSFGALPRPSLSMSPSPTPTGSGSASRATRHSL